MYTIGQVSEMFALPASTLRYYDKEGLFPSMKRNSGARQFDEASLETLQVINCLKLSGLEIKDIKKFIEWCAEGSATYEKRRELFLEQREAVLEEMERMQKTLALILFKCWYYEQAIADGNEERITAMLPDKLPPEIQALYDQGHGKALS